MTSTCLVDRCGRPVDGSLCADHAEQLRVTLAALPGLLEDLDVTISRQDRVNGPAVASGRVPVFEEGTSTLVQTPWAFHPDAAALADDALATLSAAAEDAGAAVGVTGAGGTVADRTDRLRALAALLVEECPNLTRHVDAADWLDQLADLSHRIQRAVSGVEPKQYLGLCEHVPADQDHPCGTELYAKQHATATACTECGADYDVPARKAELLARADDAHLTLREISSALTSLAAPLGLQRLRRIVDGDAVARRAGRPHRYAIYPVGMDGKDALYRVGDVTERLARDAERKQARRTAA